VSLTARHLEENGIPTVVLGSALDIVTHCGVPRFLFTDLPLGNPVGIPGDQPMQQEVVNLALSLFESATGPNTVVKAPVRWSDSEEWRSRYAQIKPEDRARLAAAGDARRALRDQLKAGGRVRDS